jgi:alpha-D-ribose 1-methylphosphonate 5-triphosphate synthase subunit PhnG
MLALLLALTMPVTPIPLTYYRVQVEIVRGADTVATTLMIQEGLEGRVLLEGAKSFTRLRAVVRPASTAGCIAVSLGSVAGTDKATVEKAALEPAPLLQICGGKTARASIEGGPSYRVTVHEIVLDK